MKTFIKTLFLTLFTCFISISCQNTDKKMVITDIQFMDYIQNPFIKEGNWINNKIYNTDELEEYKLKLLGKKIKIERFDTTIKIRIVASSQAKEYLLENKSNNYYSGSSMDANITKTLSNETITLKLCALNELESMKSLFSCDSIAQADYEVTKVVGGEVKMLDYKLDERCFSGKGIIITVKSE